MHSAHTDQASHAAERRLIPPLPRPCSLAPSVTTPLYSMTVSRALRQPLRSQAVSELPRMPIPRTRVNNASRSLLWDTWSFFWVAYCWGRKEIRRGERAADQEDE